MQNQRDVDYKKEKKMWKICSECGNEYRGHYAMFFFPQEGKKKKLKVRGVEICDSCLENFSKNPGVRFMRHKKK